MSMIRKANVRSPEANVLVPGKSVGREQIFSCSRGKCPLRIYRGGKGGGGVNTHVTGNKMSAY